MTRNTHWNNIKPMFNIVSFMMVILFCWTSAIYALQCCNFWDFLFSNSIVNFISCFVFIRELLSLLFCGFFSTLIEFFNLILCQITTTSQPDFFNFLRISFSPFNTFLNVFLFVCLVIFLVCFFSSMWIIPARLNTCNSMARFAPITKTIFHSFRFDKFIQLFINFASATSLHKVKSNI